MLRLPVDSRTVLVRVDVEFDWDDLGAVRLSPSGKLEMPHVPSAPGIYRFQTRGASGTEVYIGESQNVRNRMLRNYASTHTGSTNVRVRQALLRDLEAGRDVRLAIIGQARVAVDGKLIPLDLEMKDVRLLIENAALVAAREAGEQIQNLSRRPQPARAGRPSRARCG